MREQDASEELLREVLAKLDARAAWEAATTETLTNLIMQVNDMAHNVSAAAKRDSRWL